ncbi:hypothetical protein EON65_47540 [archaeon]|nr:MAG: hypothetical protein EON65_47540 [archaeon]
MLPRSSFFSSTLSRSSLHPSALAQSPTCSARSTGSSARSDSLCIVTCGLTRGPGSIPSPPPHTPLTNSQYMQEGVPD